MYYFTNCDTLSQFKAKLRQGARIRDNQKRKTLAII